MNSAPKILVAEDDDVDLLLLQRALTCAQPNAEVHVARNGKEAIDNLRTFGGEPLLLLLDLRMPGVDGFQVLQWLRKSPFSEQVSVVVLSGSGASEDIKHAADLGVKAYIVKPNDFFELVRVFQRLEDFSSCSLAGSTRYAAA